MRNKINIYLLITLLTTNNLYAEKIWEKYKPSSVNDIKKAYDIFDSEKYEKSNKKDKIGSASWSLINEDCSINKDIVFEDAVDEYQEYIQSQMKNLLKNAKGMFSNYTAMRETCNAVATTKCISGTMYDYINYDEINVKTTECMVENGKDIVKTNSEQDTGTDWVGCNVEPSSTTPSTTPFPTYPYMVNSTVVFIPCPPNIPKGTPFQIPTTLQMDTQTIDYASLNATATCQSNVWNIEMSNSFDRCLEVETKSCNDFLNQDTKLGMNQSLKNFELENTKCMIDKKFVDTEFKEFLDKKLENTKLPNNQVIKDGKVVKFDKEEQALSFKPNKEDDFELKREGLNTCKAILSSNSFEREINKSDFEDVKKFCVDYKETENMEDFVMQHLKNIKSNFHSNPKIYIAEFEILNSYVSEFKKIIYEKYTNELEYNPMQIIENYEIQSKLIKKIDLDSNSFSKSYEIYSSKYDILIKTINDMINKYRKNFKQKNKYRVIKIIQ